MSHTIEKFVSATACKEFFPGQCVWHCLEKFVRGLGVFFKILSPKIFKRQVRTPLPYKMFFIEYIAK